MKRSVIVLGAGMVGVCTALQLRMRGHEVLLVDRKAPGQETSYGNAGIIQREAVEPYAMPRRAGDLLSYGLGLNAALNYHFRALPALLPRLAAYWSASSPARYPRIARAWSTLIEHALSEHQPLIEQAQAGDLVHRSGFRLAFRRADGLVDGIARARHFQDQYGVAFELLDPEALSRAEPALTQRFVGAVHWTQPWTVRAPGELVARYARLFESLGGTLACGDAGSLTAQAQGWQVSTEAGPQQAGDVVFALGPWADDALQRLGYRLPLFVKRGYHRHYQVEQNLSMPLLCADDGVMLAPMNAGLRITTGAELTHRDAPATPVQLDKAERIAAGVLKLGAPIEPQPWMGSRPCTVDMKPVIGAAPRHRGVWFNFGHAHQGFTLGPATGRLLADLFEGTTPYVDPAPFAPTRFG